MFNFFKSNDNFDKLYQQFLNDSGAILIDVRSIEEYNSGHVPSSVNIPLSSVEKINCDKDTHLYVYCRSGSRSGVAKDKLNKMGYTNVINVGGIINYHGNIEK